ncbi:ribosome small subunit-dependent GTPase A [Nesterenkonia natronophila]|uniref:Ribosome small subunit-dependent GTPase A n=1 Tax=Nesterenkonia natronophila TaxID=2174932 RepID=A0A3A4G3X9_9MICC|nr:ribosome small subunit-dependent GTPase A [Nesterenkonia natronophila]RJN33059.1 ribosome small subunit-dependent GTPase A [Nesterenkonia natronophila]
MNRWDSWDESRARVRPNKRGSRPRTKETPDYSHAELARVVQVDRGRYTCFIEATGSAPERVVTAMRAKALRRSPVVPGDIVRLVGDTTAATGTLARLVRIEERHTLLRRSADDTDEAERVIVANADQLLIVVASAEPAPRTGFVDRALAAAYDAGVKPILLITKADLAPNPADPAGLVTHYAELDLPIVISGHEERQQLSPAALDQLRTILAAQVTVLIGHSGVGKSTIVNALTGADRATGGVNAVTGRGRHTSSSAVALRVPPDGWVVDTPGVRSFGLAHVHPDDVLGAFEDLVEGSASCEPGCRHESPSGGCALDEWVAGGHAGRHGPARLASLRSLLHSLAGSPEDESEKRLGAP